MSGLWDTVAALAAHLGRRIATRDLAAHGGLTLPGSELEQAACALKAHGFAVQLVERPLSALPQDEGPLLLARKDAPPLLVVRLDADGATLAGETQPRLALAALAEAYAGRALIAHATENTGTTETGIADAPRAPHWFWSVFALLRRHYGDCIVAALLVNLLALAGSMFSMNVYDRIIPNGALHSLWVLAIGVTLAGLIECFLRTLRAQIVDQAGKRADLILSSRIFRQTLSLTAENRPSSSAQFASHLRDFESVREFVSSTTLIALTDLPFAVLFLVVIGLLGGSLVWVPILAALLILGIGVASQWPIRKAIERYQHESVQKFAFSIEAVERLETIQALGATPLVQSRWERLCATAARSAMESRLLSSGALNLTQFVQQTAGTVLILWGVYLILDNRFSSGALIGCSILAGRALAPMAQVAGLMTRWQQARLAFSSLERIMQLPTAYDPQRNYLQMARAQGAYRLSDVGFSYPRSEHFALRIPRLEIAPGERIAVMGPVGSGKSTLLRLLGGLLSASEGQLLVDGIESRQIAPGDLRAQIAWVGQDPVLFQGTLRENLLLAAPNVGEERLREVITLTGVLNLANAHPLGLDLPLGENGAQLSGGQRQQVALARALLADTPIVLLDEPSGDLDGASEQRLIGELRRLLAGKTLLVATHRPAPLDLAERLIILDRGKIVADGPRAEVLNAVGRGQIRRQPAMEVAS